MKSYDEFIGAKTKSIRAEGFRVELSDLSCHLFDFQGALVHWSLSRGKSALFADTGLGKTLMQLEWSKHVVGHTGGMVLILAPLAVSAQTVREAERFGLEARLVAIPADLGPGINVTNYEKLNKFDDIDFAGVVLDESSILKDYTGKFRNYLIDRFASTRFRLACTATPAPNDYTELGNHAEFLGVMSRVEMLSMFFVHDGGKTQDWRLKGHAVEKFWRWVCSWSAVVRRPSDIGFKAEGYDLPELRVHDHIVESARPVGSFFHDASKMDLSARRAARRDSLSDRVSTVAEMVNDNDRSWLVWCHLNAESEALASAIPSAVEIRGSDSPQVKAKAMLDFSAGKIRVLVTKPKIAGHGMNWQHCHDMAFCGVSDSYEEIYQSIRRCWRFGQKSPVDVHVVVSEAGMVVLNNVRSKEERADKMNEKIVELTKGHVAHELAGEHMTVDTYAEDSERSDSWSMMLGDSVELVGKMEDDSIGYTIFSPPFASLYTYSASPRDMGNCADGDEFSSHFAYLVGELFRVTKPGRVLSFHCMNLPTSKARDGFIGVRDFRGELIKLFIDAGWIYHSEVCIWKDPVTAMQRTKALGLLHKQLKKDSCMSRQGIPDFLVTMRKPGENTSPVTNDNDSFPVREWQHYASPVWMDINPSDTLQYRSAREDKDERHICPLQLEVIRRALRLWTRPGDVVLSPFAGIGSEGYEAVKYGRKFVGVELKRSYYEQACRNLAAAESTPSLFGQAS